MAACEILTIPGTDAGLRRAADAFESFAGGRGVSADVRWRFLVAMNEALSKIVRHGSGDSPGEIEVTFSLADGVLGISLSNAAPFFNPLNETPQDAAGQLLQPKTGLGIALVRALMDEVLYERRNNRNHLVLTRRLAHE
jgi:anti-sigma regulatory factor (Ser/Thr protein kinase)